MQIAWTKHLKNPEEQQRFESHILSAKPVLDRLYDLLKEAQQDIDERELSFKIFDQPNWDYRQAYINGFKSCLKTIFKIINLDQKEQHDR